MEYVVISGGVAQDTSKGVHIIDLDNLAGENEIEALVASRDSAYQGGLAWVVVEIDGLIDRWFSNERARGVSEEDLSALAIELGIDR